MTNKFLFEVARLSENSETTVIIKICRKKNEQNFTTMAERELVGRLVAPETSLFNFISTFPICLQFSPFVASESGCSPLAMPICPTTYFGSTSTMQSLFKRCVIPLHSRQLTTLQCVFCSVWRQSLQPTFTRRCESFVTSLLHINTRFVVSYSARPSHMSVRCVASANEMKIFSHHCGLLVCAILLLLLSYTKVIGFPRILQHALNSSPLPIFLL